MKKYGVITLLTLAFVTCFLPIGSAVEEAAEQTVAPAEELQAELALAEEETEFSYGTVKSVTADQIVVSEYDYDSDKDVDVTYSVPAGAKFENVASLQEIKVGDAVDIDFLVKDGQKVASAITVEKPLAEDEDVLLGEEAGADAGAEAEKIE